MQKKYKKIIQRQYYSLVEVQDEQFEERWSEMNSNIVEMRLFFCAILVILPIYVTAGFFGIFNKTPKQRDYANKIGMICVHKYEA